MAERVKGMKKLLNQLAKINKDLPEKVDKIVQANGSEMAQTANKIAPTDMGGLRSSIRARRGKEKGEAIVTAGVIYAAFVEFGTGRQVRVPAEFSAQAQAAKSIRGGTFEEGLRSIRDWCRRNGIEESAAYPIFMAILRRGLKPRPFMYPALIRQRPILQNDLEKFLRRTLNI